MGWKFFAAATLLCWGLWGFFGKLASQRIPGVTVFVLSAAASVVFLLLLVPLYAGQVRLALRDYRCCFAFLAGFVGTLGTLAFYLALRRAEASKVVVVTSLYPMVTVVLAALLLRETLGLMKVLGIVLALAGIVLLSL